MFATRENRSRSWMTLDDRAGKRAVSTVPAMSTGSAIHFSASAYQPTVALPARGRSMMTSTLPYTKRIAAHARNGRPPMMIVFHSRRSNVVSLLRSCGRSPSRLATIGIAPAGTNA